MQPRSTQHPYHQAIELPFELPTRLYGAMLVIWLLRPDLQRRFPLQNANPRIYLKFLSWCTAIGRREHQILRDIDAWNQELLNPIALPAIANSDAWHPTFTVGMYLCGLHRAKYWNAQMLTSAKIRHRTARWYFREGRQLIGLTQLPEWQLNALHRQFETFEAFNQHLKLPKDSASQHTEIRRQNQDIAMAWGAEEATPGKTPVPSSHAASNLLSRSLPVFANKVLPWWHKGRKRPSASELTRMAELIPNPSKQCSNTAQSPNFPFGVNLYGYARGELGIGEDVRMMARAFKAANIPFCIINIQLGDQVSQHDRTAEHWISNLPLYSINLFCMTGIEMARYVCIHGQKALENRYTIGLWPWELPEWPKAWHHAWSLVDELWGISHYAASAYRQAPVPVHPMPLPAELGEVRSLPRAHWGLPESAYLFVFAFDMNSTLSRKNPEGLIDAFHLAFPDKTDTTVGLVLKVSHLNRSRPEWRSIAKHIDNDPRIYLVGEELRKPDVLALYNACDCVVSLHRSEGFGRMLAEAQLLGKLLITTGYSGNMDFCASPPTITVKYTQKALEPNEYFFGDGQYWAEPDLNEAASAMRLCATDPQYRKNQPYNTERFSPEYCGRAFKTRLTQIAQRLETSQRTEHD